MRTELAVAIVAGLFGLVPLMVQIATTRAQRRDRMSRLNQLRAELGDAFIWNAEEVRAASLHVQTSGNTFLGTVKNRPQEGPVDNGPSEAYTAE